MLRQMQYFVAVVENGSFSEAAEVCHISQSAISQQIRALEDELGVELLSRHGRRFSLTPAGEYFCQHARKLLSEADTLTRETRRIGAGEHLQLRIGVLSGFSGRIMQGALRSFSLTHPGAQLTLFSGTHEELFQRVVSGALDLVVNDQRRALADHFVNVFLGEQPLFAMLRQDGQFTRRSFLSLQALSQRLCLIVAPPEQRESETTFWRDVMGVRSDILFVDGVEAACLNAAAGTGWYPCDQDTALPPDMALLPIAREEGTPLTRRMFAFWPEQTSSALKHEFAEALVQHFV